ncbi:MAG: hypothetical protein O2973_03525 [Gemmatimonadetes bacterium]|nr:hypothetical protein [Gemmatimonadota bacterium]
MTTNSKRRRVIVATLSTLSTLTIASASLYAAACVSSSGTTAMPEMMASMPAQLAPPLDMGTTPPMPDPRVGLRPGRADSTRRIMTKAAEAAWNMRLLSNSATPERFVGSTNSDLAFKGGYVFQGNYSGYMVWNISNPSAPKLSSAFYCPASQSDVSVYKNLLFVSAEAASARLDCGPGGVQDSVSTERIRGIRIFDITDMNNPKYLTNVQTCRGSHTHTVVPDINDPDNVYIYISGSSRVRPEGELTGCSDLAPDASPTGENFRIEVIKVPVANPARASIVSTPRIFQGLEAVTRHADPPVSEEENVARGRGGRAGAAPAAGAAGGRGGRGGAPVIRTGPSQCHDITVYPAIGYAGGACGGYGLLLDIKDVPNPRRVFAVSDSNFAFWHSATFSNDGSKVLFTDEWGGGGAPRCRATDKYEWGGNAMFSIQNAQMAFKGYYKMPAAQTVQENCVAHNGSLIPIPGREVMVQGWYQGGISVFDWTDPSNAFEIAFHDRGPLDGARMMSAGSWSVYWYNGYIVSSEIARGLDIFELQPSGFLTQNEIDAAKTVKFEYLNAQEQPQLVWPPSFAKSRAFVDQLERSRGYSAAKVATIRAELAAAEKLSGQAQKDALGKMATALHGDARGSSDAPKAHLLAFSVGDLAK